MEENIGKKSIGGGKWVRKFEEVFEEKIGGGKRFGNWTKN